MASDILKKIIEQKIDIFAGTFGEDASNIFTRDKKLFHPLEYGMYKERCIKELLSFVSSKSVGISDGFLITSKNSVSTQCDIVMYDKDTIPLIDNGIAHFYPVEIVKGIGEVKSTLNKVEFTKALVKLARNKLLYQERKGRLKSEERRFSENSEIFSFLVCNKLSFDITKIDFDEVYNEISDVKCRHNVVLSLQDGILTYTLNFSELPTKQKEHFINMGGDIKANPVIWNYPHHTEEDEFYKCCNNFIKINYDDKYKHIIHFLIIIKAHLEEGYEYDFDFVEYLTNDKVKIFS